MQTKPIYLIIANAVQARANCITSGNKEWQAKHEETIENIIKEQLPSGGGFDNGTQIDLNRSNGERLVFTTAYHHMNDGGYYDGWTEHAITVTPNFSNIRIKVSGRNRNDIKDYIAEMFHNALMIKE
jgi:hypothetical protein